MNRKVGWLLTGAIVGIVAVGPWQTRSEAGTGKAMIRINEQVLAATRLRVDESPLWCDEDLTGYAYSLLTRIPGSPYTPRSGGASGNDASPRAVAAASPAHARTG